MSRRLSSVLCASALLLAGAAGFSATAVPAAAQVSMGIGFNYFHGRLGHYGRWIHHPVWGDVWRPRRALVGADFQPYTNGHWELTDEYGWYWVSDDPFDDVVYHYGRWVYDPQYEWLWVPGYTWAPAWVVWREGDDYTGWAPLPPDEAFVTGAGLSFGVDLGPVAINFYDRWYGGRVDPSRFFVFVDNRHLVDRDYRRFVVPRERIKVVLGRTREVTKFEVANGRVVNRGIDVRVVERATGRRIAPVSFKAVVKPNAVITTVNEAKQIRERERVAHPIDVNAVKRGERGGNGPGAGGANQAESTAPGNANGKARQNGGSMNSPDNTGETGGRNRGNAESTSVNPNANGAAGGESGGNRSRNRGNENGAASGESSGSESRGAPAGENPRRSRNGNTEGAASGANDNGGAMSGNGRERPGAGASDNEDNSSGGMRRRTAPAAGGMNGPGPDQGNSAGMASPEPGTTPPRQRRPSPAGGMSGPAAGNGAPAETNPASAPPKARNKAQPTQPGSSDAEQKDKRKPTAQPPNTPQQ